MSFVKKAAGALTGRTARRRITRAGRRIGTAIGRAGEIQAGAVRRGLGRQLRGVAAARREAVTGYEDISRLYGEARRELAPIRAAGAEAFRRFARPLTQAELLATPGVQFRLGEAQRAFERGAAARGRLLGGGAQRELGRYMQRLAAEEYGAEFERRRGAAGLGLEAVGRETALIQAQAEQRRMQAERLAGLRLTAGEVEAARVIRPEEIRAQAMVGRVEAREMARMRGAAAQQQAIGGLIGAGTRLAGAGIGAFFGGPAGAAAGMRMGGEVAPEVAY